MTALDSQIEKQSHNKDEKDFQNDDDEELAFLSRRFQKLMMRRNQFKKSIPTKNAEMDVSQIRCYGCNRLGHYKNECLNNQKKAPFKKSMMATWDDLEDQAEETEEANMCLMTRSENKEVSSKSCSSCKRTEHLFDNLLYDSQITTLKNDQPEIELAKIIKERNIYKTKNEKLEKDLEIAQDKIKELVTKKERKTIEERWIFI
jgi:hypothetical protein